MSHSREINIRKELLNIRLRLSDIDKAREEIAESERLVKLAICSMTNKGEWDDIKVWLGPPPKEEE